MIDATEDQARRRWLVRWDDQAEEPIDYASPAERARVVDFIRTRIEEALR